MVRALLSATLPKRGCCQPSEPSCQRNFTFKKCQDKEIDGWFRAAGAGLIAWVKVRGQGWLQLLAPGGRILPGLFPAQGSAAARRGGRKEKLVLWFKATLLAWHFHCFHLFFHCISVAARGTSFLDCFQGNPSFSSLSSTLLWVSFRNIFPLPSLSLSCQRQECFPESG